jgi:pheromone shutdown protein TraB
MIPDSGMNDGAKELLAAAVGSAVVFSATAIILALIVCLSKRCFMGIRYLLREARRWVWFSSNLAFLTVLCALNDVLWAIKHGISEKPKGL